MSLPVKVGKHAKDDLAALSKPLLAEAVRLMAALKDSPTFGQQLTVHPDVGDLSDCRKIYFDQARHRIVYRLLPNEASPNAVEVIAIGRRANLSIYMRAAQRLGRIPGLNAPRQ